VLQNAVTLVQLRRNSRHAGRQRRRRRQHPDRPRRRAEFSAAGARFSRKYVGGRPMHLRRGQRRDRAVLLRPYTNLAIKARPRHEPFRARMYPLSRSRLRPNRFFDSPNAAQNVFESISAFKQALANNNSAGSNAALGDVQSADTYLNRQLAFYGSVIACRARRTSARTTITQLQPN